MMGQAQTDEQGKQGEGTRMNGRRCVRRTGLALPQGKPLGNPKDANDKKRMERVNLGQQRLAPEGWIHAEEKCRPNRSQPPEHGNFPEPTAHEQVKEADGQGRGNTAEDVEGEGR